MMEKIYSQPRRHLFVADLLAEAPIPTRGILSQTLSDDEDVRVVLFSFAAGEELSEHTAARPAIVHILSGDGEVEAEGEVYAAAAGSWLRMAAGTSHAIRARSGMVMALYLLPRRESPGNAG
jgi:quercetin dioxygenase-like cupin family protein